MQIPASSTAAEAPTAKTIAARRRNHRTGPAVHAGIRMAGHTGTLAIELEARSRCSARNERCPAWKRDPQEHAGGEAQLRAMLHSRSLRSISLGALVAATLAVSLGGAPAGADTPVTIRVGAGANDTVSNLFDAVQLGYFKARGLDVQIQLMTSGAAEAAAVAGGALDIAESNVVSLSAAHLRGIPFVFIAPGAQYVTTSPTTLMICPKTSTLKTGKDLDGKNFGVVALADLSQLGPVTWIDSTGGDGSSVHYVEMPAAGMAAALDRGTVDAAMIPEPALQIALAGGTTKVCAKAFDSVAPSFMLNGWITTADWLKKNPDVARKFRDAMLEAAKWASKNHQASAAIFKQYSKAPPEIIDTMTRATFAERLDPDLVQPVINAAAKYKFIDHPFPAADILAP